MKKQFLAVVVLILLLTSTCFAQETIPARYLPILQEWDATTGEEMRLKIIEHWKNIEPVPDNKSHWVSKYHPLDIRFGGTTEELIADRKNWQLAIVSSKDVDLQEMLDQELITPGEHYPDTDIALYQWLLPDKLSYVLNKDPMLVSDVYVYDYDAETDDATLLLCQPVPQRNNPPSAASFAEEIMWKRSAATARALQGMRLIPDRAGWEEEDFLAHSEEWDVGILRLKKDQTPTILDQERLLYDFSQIIYFASRTSIKPSKNSVDLANGIFNTNGQMIGVPCLPVNIADEDPDIVGMLIVNAKSPCLERALVFAEHYMRSLDWIWGVSLAQGGGAIPAISRDDVTW